MAAHLPVRFDVVPEMVNLEATAALIHDVTRLPLAIAEKAPDPVLLDWELPGLPATYLLRLLRYERPSLSVIAMSSRPEACQAALDADVQAFVSKSEPPERVLAIVRRLL